MVFHQTRYKKRPNKVYYKNKIIKNMRAYLIGILCCILLQGHSQKLVKTYYSESWGLTSKSMATYCRVGFIDTATYRYSGIVNDYYLKTGKLQMTGNYLSNLKNGSFKFFYPDGSIKTEGNYLNNMRYGIWTNYYKNGSFRDKMLFNNNLVIPISYYDSNGIQKLNQGTGEWTTEYFDDLKQVQVTINCYFQDSLREGEWNFYVREMNLDTLGLPMHARSETYHQGTFVKGKGYILGKVSEFITPTSNLIPEPIKFDYTENWMLSMYACIEEYPFLKFLPKLDSTMLPVDSQAEFPGGLDSLINTITHNKGVVKCGREGYDNSYKIKITIDESGKLSFKTGYNYYDDFYKEFIRVIKKLPSWKPAKRNGEKVPNYFTLFVFLKDGQISARIYSLNEIKKTG